MNIGRLRPRVVPGQISCAVQNDYVSGLSSMLKRHLWNSEWISARVVDLPASRAVRIDDQASLCRRWAVQ
jgi:hypothetical protein